MPVGELFFFSIGLILASTLDVVWRLYFYGEDKGILRILEHYHWGLIFMVLYLLLGNPVLLGLGAGLVIAEALQKHPFSLGSDHFPESTIIGIALLIALSMILFTKMLPVDLHTFLHVTYW